MSGLDPIELQEPHGDGSTRVLPCCDGDGCLSLDDKGLALLCNQVDLLQSPVGPKRQNTATRKRCPLCQFRLFPVSASECGKYHQNCVSIVDRAGDKKLALLMLRAGIYDVSDNAKKAFLEHMEHKKEARRASAELAEAKAQLEHTKKEKKRAEAVVTALYDVRAYPLHQLGHGNKRRLR